MTGIRNSFLATALSQTGNAAVPKAEEIAKVSAAPGVQTLATAFEQTSASVPADVDVAQIQDSQFADRFNLEESLDSLVESIRQRGQEMPVLLRYRKSAGQKYEVVYGRRRIAACRKLGIPVKAIVRDIDERTALLLQAQENAERLQTSFVEQALFALNLSKANWNRTEICEALSVDKPTLSKMLSVATGIPHELIFAIGAAPEAGRRPWLSLKEAVVGFEPAQVSKAIKMISNGASSDERLKMAVNSIVSPPKTLEKPKPIKRQSVKGAPNIKYATARNRLVVEVGGKDQTKFLEFLEVKMDDLFEQWKVSREDA